MIRVRVLDTGFNRAWMNAKRAFPVEPLESPRQYGKRWRKTYKCRYDRGEIDVMIFDRDEDFTWFMLRWG